MKYNNESHIASVEDVKTFFHYIVDDRKVNFHPDDPFDVYESIETGEPTFTKDEVELFNRLMDESFTVCDKAGADIYEIGLDVLQPWTEENSGNVEDNSESNKESKPTMEQNKKELLLAQVKKLEEVVAVLEENFDIENEIPDEFSFLDIAKNNLRNYANQ